MLRRGTTVLTPPRSQRPGDSNSAVSRPNSEEAAQAREDRAAASGVAFIGGGGFGATQRKGYPPHGAKPFLYVPFLAVSFLDSAASLTRPHQAARANRLPSQFPSKRVRSSRCRFCVIIILIHATLTA